MARRQKDPVDIGSILQLWNAFSPEAQARTQLTQAQAQAAQASAGTSGQLSQLQLDALRGQIANQAATTSTIVPDSQARRDAIVAQITNLGAGTEQTRAQTGLLTQEGPLKLQLLQGQNDSLAAETDRTRAMTSEIPLTGASQRGLAEAQTGAIRAKTPAEVAQLASETGYRNLLTSELPAMNDAQKRLLGTEAAANVIGKIAPYADKSMNSELFNHAMGFMGPEVAGIPGVVEAKKRAAIEPMFKASVEKLGFAPAVKSWAGAIPQDIVDKYDPAKRTNVDRNTITNDIPADDPYKAKITDLAVEEATAKRDKELTALGTQLPLIAQELERGHHFVRSFGGFGMMGGGGGSVLKVPYSTDELKALAKQRQAILSRIKELTGVQ